MLEDLKFVQGAVAKKDYVPALTHFRIQDGFIKGFNGSLSLCSPINIDLDITPKAVQFAKAIETCKDTVVLSMTNGGRLSIRSGKFKAFIECLEDATYPDTQPEGEYIDLQGSFINVLRKIAPFIAEDASRPWATGVLFRGKSLFATNNVILIEHWLGYEFPVEINLPKTAIKELLRIKEEPIGIQVSANTITFHYANGRWLRTNVLDTAWPDVAPLLNSPSEPKDLTEEFFSSLSDLKPFTNDLDKVYFSLDKLSTEQDSTLGASVDIEGVYPEGAYNLIQLLALNGVADKIDFSRYPDPAVFYGENLRGVVIGMRI